MAKSQARWNRIYQRQQKKNYVKTGHVDYPKKAKEKNKR